MSAQAAQSVAMLQQATDAARTVMAKLSTDLGATAGTAVQTLRGLVTEVSLYRLLLFVP